MTDVGNYIKSAGLALSAALVAAAVWDVGSSIYARVAVSRVIAPDRRVALVGAMRLIEFTPLVVVIVFAVVFGLVFPLLRGAEVRSEN